MKQRPDSVEVLEARIAPAVDLLLLDFSLALPAGGVTVPGDSVGVSFSVANFGDTTANAPNGTSVELWLSANQTLGSLDLKLGNLRVPKFSLDALESTSKVTGKFTMPTLSLPTPVMPAGDYYIIARLISPVGESNTANNTEPTDATFPYLFQFGNVGARKNVPLAIGGSDALKLTMTGAGIGEVAPDGARLDMTFTGTDGTSMAKLTAKEGFGIEFDDITASGPLGSLHIFDSNVRGDLRFNGGISKLVAGAIDPFGVSGDDSVLVIGGALGKPAMLDIFAVADLDISSSVGIASLETHIWLDRNHATSPVHDDMIIAPYVNKLHVTPTPKKTGTVPIAPEFHADLYLTGDPSATYVLNDVKITGPVMDATWFLASTTDLDVNKISLERAEDWKLVVSGTVKKLVVQSWDNTGTSGAMLDALTAGDVIVGEITGDSIILRGSDGVNVAAKRIVIGDVIRLDALSAMQGGIESLGTYRWADDTAIETEWIKTLAVLRGLDSSFLPNITLTGAGPSGASLAKAFIAHTMDGTWTAAAGFGRLEFDHLEGTLNSQAFIDSIKADDIKSADIDAVGEIGKVIAGDWSMGSLEASELKSLLINGRPAEGSGKLTDVTVRLQKSDGVTDRFTVAGLMQNVSILGSPTYVIKSLTADAWNGGTLDVGSVGKLAFDGKLAGSNGFLVGVDIDLRSRSAEAGGGSLKELKVAGAVDTTQIDLAFEAGKVSVGKLLESEFNAQGDVKSFTVTGASGGVEPASFKNSLVSGHIFGTIVVVDVASAGPGPYGFDTQGIVSYKRKDAGPVVATLSGPPSGIYDVLGNYAVTVA